MYLVKDSKKIISTLAFVISGLIFAASIYVDFSEVENKLFSKKSVSFGEEFGGNDKRSLASTEKNSWPMNEYITLNQLNRESIDGAWRVERVSKKTDLNLKASVLIFDRQKNADKNRNLIVGLKLMATSLVRINESDDLLYDISSLDKVKKMITLYRSFENYYEIIEAVKVNINEPAAFDDVSNIDSSAVLNQERRDETNTKTERYDDLSLERSLFVEKAGKAGVLYTFVKGEVSGGGTVIKDAESGKFQVSIDLGIKIASGEMFKISIDESTNDGGQFSYEENGEEISGIITSNGPNGFRVRLASGPHGGSLFNLVTEEEKNELVSKEQEALNNSYVQRNEVSQLQTATGRTDKKTAVVGEKNETSKEEKIMAEKIKDEEKQKALLQAEESAKEDIFQRLKQTPEGASMSEEDLWSEAEKLFNEGLNAGDINVSKIDPSQKEEMEAVVSLSGFSF